MAQKIAITVYEQVVTVEQIRLDKQSLSYQAEPCTGGQHHELHTTTIRRACSSMLAACITMMEMHVCILHQYKPTKTFAPHIQTSSVHQYFDEDTAKVACRSTGGLLIQKARITA